MRKTTFAFLFSGGIVISVVTGCDNNGSNSRSTTGMDHSGTSYNNGSTGVTTGSMDPVGGDGVGGDQTGGNLGSTDHYNSTGTTSTTYSTSSGTDSDASMR